MPQSALCDTWWRILGVLDGTNSVNFVIKPFWMILWKSYVINTGLSIAQILVYWLALKVVEEYQCFSWSKKSLHRGPQILDICTVSVWFGMMFMDWLPFCLCISGRWILMNFLSWPPTWSDVPTGFSNSCVSMVFCSWVTFAPLLGLVAMRWTQRGWKTEDPKFCAHIHIYIYISWRTQSFKKNVRLGFQYDWHDWNVFWVFDCFPHGVWDYPWFVGAGKVTYALLAHAAYKAGMKLFRFRPKYHLGVHLALDIHYPVAINPWCR